jgi:hypothetical protein
MQFVNQVADHQTREYEKNRVEQEDHESKVCEQRKNYECIIEDRKRLVQESHKREIRWRRVEREEWEEKKTRDFEADNARKEKQHLEREEHYKAMEAHREIRRAEEARARRARMERAG